MAIRRDLDVRDQRRNPPCQNRSNEYFVPKDGIDREVITADICRYLGNDALVRPGNYENPSTNTVQPGYYITAYRNLTSAMIEDLKADSQRWDQERRAANSRENVGYTQSRTHESRQQWGPTGESNKNYPPSTNSQASFEQFPQSIYPHPPSVAYNQQLPPSSYMQQENYYVAGSNMAVEQPRGYQSPTGVEVPRVSAPHYVQVPTGQQYTNQAPSQPYGRGSYGQPLPSINNSRLRREDSNFTAQILSAPHSYQEEKKSQYMQPPPASSYGNSFNARETFNDRNFPDPGRFNHNSAPPVGLPALSQNRRDTDRENDSRDSRKYRDLGRRH
ncbi:putative transcription factor [Golovinomyces cichoracearum]|uniref:Putative transcription factor n=1 Tax=Golovinomyces cichoracearum TaxID=62708 RepID=A0A420ICR4_9PEZI|nr:putative transcription factor [Golovinomyces cichoracearum]